MRDQKPSHYNAVISIPREFSGLKLGIRTQDDMLAVLDFLPADSKKKQPDNSIARATIEQLTAYFSNPAHPFDLPLLPQGTSFQRRVWQWLRKTQVSKVYSYGEIANQLSSGARAVGNACRANPVPIVVPCHRVVAKYGIGGYCGQTDGVRIIVKRRLLQHEGGL